MNRSLALLVLIMSGAVGCTRVPPQSVELSATVGRDLLAIHASHRELASVLFERLRGDVNRFVDEVYAPSQIRAVMDQQRALATSADMAERNRSLLLAIDAAFAQRPGPEMQAKVLAGMNVLVRRVREDVESMREELLAPLAAQERQVLGAVDGAYEQVRYANSVVTAHLASVLEVHETQDELFAKAGAPDLRIKVSDTLAHASAEIGGLVALVAHEPDAVANAEETAGKLKKAIGALGARLGSMDATPSTETPNARN